MSTMSTVLFLKVSKQSKMTTLELFLLAPFPMASHQHSETGDAGTVQKELEGDLRLSLG